MIRNAKTTKMKVGSRLMRILKLFLMGLMIVLSTQNSTEWLFKTSQPNLGKRSVIQTFLSSSDYKKRIREHKAKGDFCHHLRRLECFSKVKQ